MRKFLSLFICILLTTNIFSAIPAIQPATAFTRVKPDETYSRQQVLLYALTNHLTVKQYQKFSGKKLTLKQKIGYVILKHKLVKADGADETGSIIGGFLLGFTLGLIGVAITYIFSKNRTFRKWSWIGFGAWVVLLLIILLIAAATLGGWN